MPGYVLLDWPKIIELVMMKQEGIIFWIVSLNLIIAIIWKLHCLFTFTLYLSDIDIYLMIWNL